MKRRLSASILVLMMLLTLTACGGSGGNKATMDMAMTESAPSSAPMEDMKVEAEESYGGGVKYEEPQAAGSASDSSSAYGRKLICTARLEMETTEFDTAIDALTDLTEQYEGYFENTSIRNRGSGYRSAEYTIRVPADRYQAFLNQAGELCHETWRNTSQEDVSEHYYDTQGRLKTQQIKLERLQALLAKAELMEDIITIESAISETEWAIESLSGTLRHYDALVDYATVYINISEVYKLSNVEDAPDSFGDRMGSAFANGMRSFADNMENLAVSFAYSWMWWLLLVAVVVVAIRVVRGKKLPKISFRRKNKRDKQDEN